MRLGAALLVHLQLVTTSGALVGMSDQRVVVNE